MKGNKMKTKKMKKGGVIKAKGGLMAALSPAYAASQGGMGGLLENFSPAYSMMKGKGPIANILGMAKKKPAKAALTKKEREEQAKQQIMANRKGTSNRMTPMTGMMAGGPLKRKKSIDGCAMKGKTRGV